jgi:ABC-type glycerol-3-phosphate transport system permease component
MVTAGPATRVHRRRRRFLHAFLVHVALAIVGLIVAVPLYWTVASALSTNADIFAQPMRWIPAALHWQNVPAALSSAPFDVYFRNSTAVAVAVTGTTLLSSALAGYGFAKFRFPGRRVLFVVVLAAMMVPFQAIMIPLFVMVRELGWLNSFAGLIIPGAVSGFGIFLMRQFMSRLPDELCEAARIDGCGELRLFVSIILPLSRSALSALAVLTFLASWNNFLWPLIVVQNTAYVTVPLGLVQFRGSNSTDYTGMLAASLIAAAPVVLLYILMQRQIIGTFATSGIKG